MLYVERSHRTENLLQGLATRLMSPRTNPLAPAIVVVQGQGMERWIAQSIASEYGVCANTKFLFPRALLETVFDASQAAALAENQTAAQSAALLGPNPAWDRERLVWSIAKILEEEADAPALAPLARQLSAPDRDWRIVQLAARIAVLIDDYITFRPDWVERWQRAAPDESNAPLGSHEVWQAWIFRRLRERLGEGHLADQARAFLANIDACSNQETSPLRTQLSRRFASAVEVFAISTLPPIYLSVLDGLSRIVDVRLSVLSPSREYWADLWAELRDEGNTPRSAPNGSVTGLLAGLGRLGGDFQNALENLALSQEGEFDARAGSQATADEVPTLLQALQRQILDLESAEARGSRTPIAESDRSLQVHFCHGPKRELEVVKTALQEAFDADPTLSPEDVIVMSPDIDSLVPMIDAVFGGADGSGAKIPYRVADRGMLRRSPVAEAFVALLALLPGRATRSEVLDWLSLEPVRSRLGLDAEGIEGLGEWAARAGIRFGLDEDHREGLGLAARRAHTWAEGIDRLVLGHAVGATSEVYAGLSPVPLGLLLDSNLLGAIGELEATLSQARRDLSVPRTVGEWAAWLTRLLSATMERRDENAHEHAMIRSATSRMSDAAAASDFEDPIPFEAIRERFEEGLQASPPAQGFLSGGVTFCELVPLRAIPFRIIAIVGLSDTAFPRRRPVPHYDLMAQSPRPGDRNGRSDDRYLFLEALISARDRLVLTVPQHDLRDGADQPPSVVLSELLDVLDAEFEVAESDRRSRDRIVVEHPLHSFSARYFEVDRDSRLLGLDEEAFRAAEAKRVASLESTGTRRFLAPFARGGKVEPDVSRDEPNRILTLKEMSRRILRSTQFFAERSLGMRLPRPANAVSDFDPIDLDFLDRATLGEALLADRRANAQSGEAVKRLAANARLPAGEPGELARAALFREVDEVQEIARGKIAGGAGSDRAFEIALGNETAPRRLVGTLRDWTPQGLARIQFSRLGGQRELEFWMEHLVACALAIENDLAQPRSVLVGRPESSTSSVRCVEFAPVDDARAELEVLFDWACSVDHAPLPFFPKTSRTYFSQLAKGKKEQARRAAFQSFYGGESGGRAFPEFEQDLAMQRVWEGVIPLDASAAEMTAYSFGDLAQRFFDRYQHSREAGDV